MPDTDTGSLSVSKSLFFPFKVRSGPLERSFYLFSVTPVSLPGTRQLYSRSSYSKFANSNFIPLIFSYFPASITRFSRLISFCFFLVIARNLSMKDSIRSFEKILFSPKSRLNVQLKVKLPNMTDWHILLGLKIDVLIACRRLSVSPQNVECVLKIQCQWAFTEVCRWIHFRWINLITLPNIIT